ncbi:hypothetical protein D3C76_571150 [compost metagenome]
MKPALPSALLGLCACLGGCEQNYSLSPPLDSETFRITVSLPKRWMSSPLNKVNAKFGLLIPLATHLVETRGQLGLASKHVKALSTRRT